MKADMAKAMAKESLNAAWRFRAVRMRELGGMRLRSF